jgi:protein pelota
VLENPTVRALISDTKAASEVKALDDFFEMLANDPTRAFYGPAHVVAAHELNAIDKLLLTDALFRTRNVGQRKMWVRMTEEVTKSGGTVHIFSSAHASGDQLEQITGAAAILRFPLPDLADAELAPLPE